MMEEDDVGGVASSGGGVAPETKKKSTTLTRDTDANEALVKAAANQKVPPPIAPKPQIAAKPQINLNRPHVTAAKPVKIPNVDTRSQVII